MRGPVTWSAHAEFFAKMTGHRVAIRINGYIDQIYSNDFIGVF